MHVWQLAYLYIHICIAWPLQVVYWFQDNYVLVQGLYEIDCNYCALIRVSYNCMYHFTWADQSDVSLKTEPEIQLYPRNIILWSKSVTYHSLYSHSVLSCSLIITVVVWKLIHEQKLFKWVACMAKIDIIMVMNVKSC